jgi:hypothetical protein
MDTNKEKPNDRSSWVGAVKESRQSDGREQPWKEDVEHKSRPKRYLTVEEVLLMVGSRSESAPEPGSPVSPPPPRPNPPIPTT